MACAVSLVSCAAGPAAEPDSDADDQILQIRPLPAAQRPSALPDDESRLIADLLFAGLQALDADRLLTPVDDSAHGRFQRVAVGHQTIAPGTYPPCPKYPLF